MKQIKKLRVGDEVFEQMKKNIIDGIWKSGEKIPGENDLCKMLGVSRVSVREAIHRLVGMGVLEIKRGEGTFISEVISEDAFNSFLSFLMVEQVDFKEVLEFRRILDLGGVVLAARNSNEEDINLFHKLSEKLKNNVGNDKDFSKTDLEFHTAIALASKNKLLIKVTAILHDLLHKTMDQSIKSTGYEAGIKYHSTITDAISKHDEKEALKQMSLHYDEMIERTNNVDYKISTGNI